MHLGCLRGSWEQGVPSPHTSTRLNISFDYPVSAETLIYHPIMHPELRKMEMGPHTCRQVESESHSPTSNMKHLDFI